MDAQVDAAKPHEHDYEAKADDAESAHEGVLLVAPDHPDEQPVERHRHHGVAGREAEAAFCHKAVTLRARALYQRLEQQVEQRGKYEVDRGAQPGATSGGEHLDHQEHHHQHHGVGEV